MRTFSLLLHVENDTWTCYGLIWAQAPASMLFKVFVQALVLDSVQNLGSLRYTLIVVKEGLGMVYLLLGRRPDTGLKNDKQEHTPRGCLDH